jgi:hypothetical protein
VFLSLEQGLGLEAEVAGILGVKIPTLAAKDAARMDHPGLWWSFVSFVVGGFLSRQLTSPVALAIICLGVGVHL